MMIEARGLELRHGDRVALASSDFTIPTGQVTALIGPNGAGKSTLLSAIAGVLPVSAGTLAVGGRPPIQMRSRVAYVLQTTKVNETAPLTVSEVVTMGRYPGKGLLSRLGPVDRQAVTESLERMKLTELADRHLHELSGGERQRVLVAQGLAQDHDLLMLDEPLTGLDILSAETIDAVIHDEQGRGRTVILTTHDLAEAGAADYVLLLAGRVVASGPPGQALTPETLLGAYGAGVLHADETRDFLDDPAHRAADPRHVHRERE